MHMDMAASKYTDAHKRHIALLTKLLLARYRTDFVSCTHAVTLDVLIPTICGLEHMLRTWPTKRTKGAVELALMFLNPYCLSNK